MSLCDQCVDVEDEELKARYLSVLEDVPMANMQTYMGIKGANCSPGKVPHNDPPSTS